MPVKLIQIKCSTAYKQVEIYRPNQEIEVLQSPANLSGEDVLPEFFRFTTFPHISGNLKLVDIKY